VGNLHFGGLAGALAVPGVGAEAHHGVALGDQLSDIDGEVVADLPEPLVPPSLLVSKLQNLQRQNRLHQAIQELRRLAKTRHLLAYVDDGALRHRVLVGLNRQERTHAMARAIFFGRQARLPDRGHKAQLNRASALSLAINAIVVWNTRYLSAAADHLAQHGRAVPDTVWSHLSPLLWEHIPLSAAPASTIPASAASCAPSGRQTASPSWTTSLGKRRRQPIAPIRLNSKSPSKF
jgi:hypothetical protein